jgi:hypothetical protein
LYHKMLLMRSGQGPKAVTILAQTIRSGGHLHSHKEIC